MILKEKNITLKNGKNAILKSPCMDDAEKLLHFIQKSCGETDFLARYPEDWEKVSIEKEEAWVKQMRETSGALAITCYVDGEIIGNSEIRFRGSIKTAHRATIGIAILKDFWNLGIGSAMFENLIDAARQRDTEIIELEFIKGNERAKRLYEKFGFRIVSEKPNAFKLKDGTYQSEIYMQKYLK